MNASWTFRCGAVLVGATLACQQAPPRSEPTADPIALAQAMPAETPLAAGHAMTLFDARSNKPLGGATVILHEIDGFTPTEQRPHILAAEHPTDAGLGELAGAVRFGRKWTADGDGKVVIPENSNGTLYVVAGDLFERVDTRHRHRCLALVPRAWIQVRVHCHDGIVAKGVPLRLEADGSPIWDGAGVPVRARTDARGRARLELPPFCTRDRPGLQMRVVADMVGAASHECRIDQARWCEGDPGPVGLQLPAYGTLRFTAVDADRAPQPFKFLVIDQQRLQLDPGDAPQCLAAVGSRCQVQPFFDHELGLRNFEVAGPQRHGEVVDVCIDPRHGQYCVRMRLIGKDGMPVASSPVMAHSIGTTDDQGRFTVVFGQQPVPAELVVRARTANGDSAGGIKVTLPRHPAGLHDFGAVTLAEEPVLLAGEVIDDEGRPVAGATVSHGFDFQCFGAQCTSDARGRFELRHLDPGIREVPIEVHHRDFQPWCPFALSTRVNQVFPGIPRGYEAGRTDVRIVLSRPE